MSELPGVLAVGANYETEPFLLSGNTQSLLFYALQSVSNKKAWLAGPLDEISDSDYEQVLDLIDIATREIMEAATLTPIGTVALWPGVVPPDGWLTCQGQELSRTTYAELFSAIGTLWGAGNGTTTFNIPDMTYRIPMGASSVPPLDPGQYAGEATHTLTTAEIPAHNHAVTQTPHSHPPVSPATVFVGRHATGSTDWIRATAGATFDQMSATGTANANITIDNAGGGAGHNNIPPVAGFYFIIYVGA